MALSDGFLNPTHRVIYNRLGINHQDHLRQAEAELRLPAMLRITTGQMRLPGHFDAAHIQQIRRATFQDVYTWAGQTRANDHFRGRSRRGFEE